MEVRVSFTFVLTVLTLILSLVPAIVIWVVFMDLMTSSVDLLRNSTQLSTEVMSQRTQQMLMTEAMDQLNARVTEGDNEVVVQQAFAAASGLLVFDLRPSRVNLSTQILAPNYIRNFPTMKGHTYFSSITVQGAIHRSTDTVAQRTFWITWVAFFIDLCGKTVGNRTLYSTTLSLSPDMQTVTSAAFCADQTTGAPVYQLYSTAAPAQYYTMPFAPSGWDTDLGFSPYSGQVQLTKWQWLPAQNDTWVQLSLSISAETISDELQAQLSNSPNDRLVLFFRQPHGHMIAASDGKYWSNSDQDRRYINPITNPPNISSYKLWSCLQSTDALIAQACQQLYAQYQSWTAIPVLRQELVLEGQLYWAATDYSSGNLQATVLLLTNRASVMGSIDASNTQVDISVANKKRVTFVILGVISAFAVLLPLAVGLWLASRLYRLAAGMDRIAKLQFTVATTPRSMFQELDRFQKSFTQMERGLQAFGKFVPQAVVKVLITGKMQAQHEMAPETVTIMFADIEGFSAICESVLPDVLVTGCTEYFEAMCSNIVQRHGTIDKFIGDCIMAIWNAPDRHPGHERDAVAAALAMQTSVLELHPDWQQRSLPLLRFRLGIHTGVCLVGNFGCSYRVSYTCLGDGVNLSARLEALNKRFGTYLCVSHATYAACCDAFHFRRLAVVTVPGKTEVLPVYEVLCEADEGLPPKVRDAPDVDLPGVSGRLDSMSCSLVAGHHHQSLYRVQSPLRRPDNLQFDRSHTGLVPYHWTYVGQAALLQHADWYEQAYDALVSGDREEAERLLRAEPLLTVPDKAWAALAEQLAHAAAGQPWDGVFRFREK